jgi:hypothetical protein
MVCLSCRSSDFRNSKLRRADLPCLLKLEYPVRCRICQARAFAGFLTALRLRGTSKARHEERHKRESTSV